MCKYSESSFKKGYWVQHFIVFLKWLVGFELMTFKYEHWNLFKPVSNEKFTRLVRIEFDRFMIRLKTCISQVIQGFYSLCNLSYKIDSNLYNLCIQGVIKAL